MGSRLGSACRLAGALGGQLPLGNKGLVNPVDILLLRLLDQSLQRVGVGISVGVPVVGSALGTLVGGALGTGVGGGLALYAQSSPM